MCVSNLFWLLSNFSAAFQLSSPITRVPWSLVGWDGRLSPKDFLGTEILFQIRNFKCGKPGMTLCFLGSLRRMAVLVGRATQAIFLEERGRTVNLLGELRNQTKLIYFVKSLFHLLNLEVMANTSWTWGYTHNKTTLRFTFVCTKTNQAW